MSNGWIDTFKRVNWENIDGKFATNVMTMGAETPSRTQIDDLRFVSARAGDDKVYHDEFKIMTRYISNYVFYKGVVTPYVYWNESQDADMAYLEENHTTDEEIMLCLRLDHLTKLEFDWDKRIMKCHHDAALRPKDEWIPEDKFWNMDGLPIGYESADTEFEGTCIVAKDLYAWGTKSYHLSGDKSVEYTKPANETYIFVYMANVKINGVVVPQNTCLNVVSTTLNIEATGKEAVIVVKEKK